MSVFGMSVIGVGSVFFAGTAALALSRPRMFAERLGLATVGKDGLNEVRGQYGGFFGAVAICGALSLGGFVAQAATLVLYAALFGGLVFGRFLSLALDRANERYSPMILALFVIDSAGLALTLAALRFG